MSNRTPRYRLHKPSGQAVVTLNGRDFYLGKHGSTSSRLEYDRLVAEWLTAGRQVAPSTRVAPRPDALGGTANDASVSELMVGYVKHVDAYYVKNGEPTSEAG